MANTVNNSHYNENVLGHQEYRNTANKHYEEWKRHNSMAKENRKAGNRSKANELSKIANEHRTQMNKNHERAKNAAFAECNKNNPRDVMDLHYLTVNEAREKLQTRLDEFFLMKEANLTIIVGKGKNSVDGKPKLKPEMQKFLASFKKLQVTHDKPNAGCIFVERVSDEIGFFDYARNILKYFRCPW
ncbi:hypothetical protein BGZ51_002483 [Haplosporangium sp. Z 767]|nr:hypothetical protein BGZ51_002483 [Haplosporangium sp. Z 767]